MKKIGYMRLNETIADEENEKILGASGCDMLLVDVRGNGRPTLNSVLAGLGNGDVLVVCGLEHIGFSLRDLVEIASHISKVGANLISLREGINTTGKDGKLIFSIFAALDSFDKILDSKSGIKKGRPKKAFRIDVAKIVKLYKSGKISNRELCREFNLTKQALSRIISSHNGGGA